MTVTVLEIYVNLSKIYVDPGITVYSNDLFTKTTVSMVLKFHLQHHETAGLQNEKFSLGENLKLRLLLKLAKALKSTFSIEPHGA